jgi:hypothetical protein
VPAEYRSWLSQRVAPLLAEHGLDRQSGGTARTADRAIAAGAPGEPEAGFPDGSLPTGGLPGVPPKDEVRPVPASAGTRSTAASS